MRAAFVVAVLLGLGCSPSVPPNIVLIIGDDHGYTDFGFMGAPVVRTPHLDRLADEGTFFPVGYATASVCRPSLNTLLTGLHPHQWELRLRQLERSGIQRARWTEIQDVQTLPRLLAERGYTSFQAGKFWEGTFDMAGFTLGMASAKKNTRNLYELMGGESLRLVRETSKPVYDFIDWHREGPFFVWFAPYLPHKPHDAPRRFTRLYQNAELPEETKRYYANITRFDAGVGELLTYLEREGLREQTLIVYLSDNGWEVSSGVRSRYGGPKGKNSLYEVGFRTPVIFSWPGHIPAGRASAALVSTVDVFATLLDYAGAELPADRSGRSLRPVLEGRADGVRDVIIGAMDEVRASVAAGQPPADDERDTRAGGRFLRDRRWHYLWYEEGDDELYDLEEDPAENHNVAAQHAERIEEFRRRVREWDAETRRGFAPSP